MQKSVKTRAVTRVVPVLLVIASAGCLDRPDGNRHSCSSSSLSHDECHGLRVIQLHEQFRDRRSHHGTLEQFGVCKRTDLSPSISELTVGPRMVGTSTI